MIKLLPGTYPASSAPTGYWYFRGRYQLSVYGPATLQSAFLLEVPTTGSGTPDLRVRDLSTTSWISCDGAGAVVVVPLLELDHVAIDLSNNPDTGSNVALNVEACKLTMRDSQVRVTDPFGNALRLAGGGGAGGQLAVVERSLLQVREGATTSGVFPISISDFASLQMSNSVVRGGSTLGGAIALGTNVSPSTVRFTTFFNTTLKCPTGVPVLASQNNIFLNELNGAAADTVTGSSCTHRFVMAKPQGTSLGADNMLNMDPRFVDGAGGDFHLIAGSPAIDAADPAATEAVDFDGTARPQGAGRDIGAFEFK